MNKIRQTRWFSVVLMEAFLVTSTLTRASVVEDAGDFHSNHSLHAKSDAPGSSDHQYPFEEKEKEFEDNSETDDKDDKSNTFTSNFFFICEVSQWTASGNDDFNDTYASGLAKTVQSVPRFLRNGTFLI